MSLVHPIESTMGHGPAAEYISAILSVAQQTRHVFEFLSQGLENIYLRSKVSDLWASRRKSGECTNVWHGMAEACAD